MRDAEVAVPADPRDTTIRLRSARAELVVNTAGGAIADFHLAGQDLNPLSWKETAARDPRRLGHFLCLDRWGPPSEAERKNGMPFHGEASRVEWEVVHGSGSTDVSATMVAALPLAGLSVRRVIRLSESAALFTVCEEVTNDRPLGRIFNMVQHPTIGPPFLDEGTFVDANGGRGFMAYRPLPNPEEPAVFWPQALRDGVPLSVRYLTDDHDPNVVSYVIDDEYGWVIAGNPAKRLMLGYLWRAKDYPWLIDWRQVKDRRPFARGLEFGTTGLPHPESALTEKGRIFGRRLFEYLDAGETTKKAYAAFLLEIPEDYRGVASVDWSDGRLVVHERDVLYEREAGPERDLTLDVGDLSPWR